MKRTSQQLKLIADTKANALTLLDTEGPLHVRVLQDRLKLQGQDGVRLLEVVLREARDQDKRAEQVQGKRGVWRSVKPGQQALPVPPQPQGLTLTQLQQGAAPLPPEQVGRALADLQIMLVALAARCGVDLDAAVKARLAEMRAAEGGR